MSVDSFIWTCKQGRRLNSWLIKKASIDKRFLLHDLLNFCHLFAIESYCEVLPKVQSYWSKSGCIYRNVLWSHFMLRVFKYFVLASIISNVFIVFILYCKTVLLPLRWDTGKVRDRFGWMDGLKI